MRGWYSARQLPLKIGLMVRAHICLSVNFCDYMGVQPSFSSLSHIPHAHAVTNARISPEMTQFVRKLVSTFGLGLEQSGLATGGSSGPLSHEALAKRAQAAAQDPAFQRLKAQFANDFDFR